MTSRKLLEALKPNKTERVYCQILANGILYNPSEFYTKLIRDAARCNRFSSDVVFSIDEIREAFREYKSGKEFEPIWIGFRRHGVDHADFIMSKIACSSKGIDVLEDEYFALYSIDVESDDPGWCYVIINEYWM